MNWLQVKNILCVRLDNMGDVLMTTPAFRALKQCYPAARLTLLTSSMGAGIAEYIPEIDAVIRFDVPWVNLQREAEGAAIMQLIATLKAAEFDAAILFTVFSQNPLPAALICYMAGIPLRLGYCRESPYALLTDWLPDTEAVLTRLRHEVERQLALVKHIGAETTDQRLSLTVPANSGHTLLRSAGIDPDRPWLILHPGVSEARRQYPADKYIAAARALMDFQIVVTGSAAERELCAAVAAAVNGVSMAGKLTLGELITVIHCAPLLISNNTGTVHIAAATQTPVIVLYAQTNPQHTPWQVPYRVLEFSVPEAARSQNVLLRNLYPQPAQDAQPQDIVTAVYNLSKEIPHADH